MDLIVSEQYLKSVLPLSENTDYKLLKLHCEESQLKFILTLLGSEYYNDLISRYVSNTLTSREINDLVPSLKRIVAYKSFSRILLTINVSIANNGVTTRTGSYFDGDDKLKEINGLQREYLTDADFWTNYALDVLNKYPTDFPLYKNTSTNLINPEPNSQKQGYGIILI
jgi:hypothetical protein